MKNKLQWGWLCVVLLSGCGGGGGDGGSTTPPPAATAPSITTQPANQTVAEGATATFTVTAAGTAPLSYQWQKSGAAIAGATSASYTTAATVAGDSGATFAVVVTNSAGSVTSNSATLTVQAAAAVAPTITTQPTNQTAAVGTTATFTVVAAGTAPLSYQWQQDGTSIAGASSATYTTPLTALADTGATFAVVVTNSAGTVTSSSATLTVQVVAGAPTITTQPASQTVIAGSTATFTVVATGTAPLSYQWQKAGVNIAGATGASYTTPATTTADTGTTFRVVVSNAVGSVTSNPATLTANAASPVAPSITTQPTAQSVQAGSPAIFKVVATGSTLAYQWRRNGTNIVGAIGSAYSIPATATGDSGALFSVVVSNSAGTVTSTDAGLTVAAVNAANGIDVLTYHYDTRRSGQNVNESLLTTANVNQATFGLKSVFVADGKVDGQPLYLSQLSISGTPHNVLFFGTEHGSIYAIDADTYTMLWKVSLIPAGQTASDDVGCTSQISPEIGITSTPVIDRNAGAHGILYAISMSAEVSGTGPYHQILHAIDVTTGADAIAPREITATFTDSHSGVTTFDPMRYVERAALLLYNGSIYTSWSSHCDDPVYGGWIITYDQATLTQNGVLNVGPSASAPVGSTDKYTASGPGIWMSGNGPAVDAAGNAYLVTGNGPFDTTLDSKGRPSGGNYSQSVLKLHSDGAALTIADYFAMRNGLAQSRNDLDLGGSGGVLLPQVPDSDGDPIDLYVVPGKDGHVYVLDQNNLGGFNPTVNTIYQELPNILSVAQVRAPPVYFNNHVYFGPRDFGIQAVGVNFARLTGTTTSHTGTVFNYPGTTPSISANGITNGIVWAYKHGSSAGELHAYDAGNLATELYNTTQAAGNRDSFGVGNKFITPMVTAGKVFLGTSTGVAIFGSIP